MKKLDVTKILVLATISIGLVACGTTQTATDATSQDSNTLKSAPKDEGGGSIAKPSKEGGGSYAEPSKEGGGSIVDEGGGSFAEAEEKSMPVDEGGGSFAEPSKDDQPETDGRVISNIIDDARIGVTSVEEGGGSFAKPEGGGSFTVELYGNVVVIQGTVQEKGQTASIILNGREFIEVQTDGLNFGAKFELEEDELKKGLNIQVVINKVVTNYYVTPEGAKLLTFK